MRRAEGLALAVSAWLSACAGNAPVAVTGGGEGKPAVPDSIESLRPDSAQSLVVALARLDTSQPPAQFASELYLLSLDNFLKVASADPRVSEVMLWKSNHLFNQKRYDEAVAGYQSLLARFPNSAHKAEANQMIAQSFERKGEHEKAESWYRGMLKDSSEAVRHEAEERVAQVIYLQGETAEKAGRFREASQAYARVPAEFPKAELAPSALFNAGVMAEKAKDWAGAIGHYGRFFESYYASELLPRVLFREAKCRELVGEFKVAGEKYRNLAKAHPNGKEAEPALYNAGFAFQSAGLMPEAALAFEEYAERFPSRPEAPNLLSRAVETQGNLKAWDKVAELQGRFARRYGGSKSRLVQALSMGGLAQSQQGNESEARRSLLQALAEFKTISKPDATARFYAAQAHQVLGDMESVRMRELPLRPGSLAADLKAKRAQLRIAVERYLSAMEQKIADGVIRSGFGMAEAFRTYGEQAAGAMLKPHAPPREKLEASEEAFNELNSSHAKAAQQYARVLEIARQQGLNNREVEAARIALATLPRAVLRSARGIDTALAEAYPSGSGTLEEILSLRLARAQRAYETNQTMAEWMVKTIPIPETGVDSGGEAMLRRYLILGRNFLEVIDSARAVAPPAGYDSVQVFFYLAKLAQELLPSIEARLTEMLTTGLQYGKTRKLDSSTRTAELRKTLGAALFARAFGLDLLARRALGNPPIPAGLPDAQRRPFEKKFEEMGYALKEQALQAHRALVESARKNLADPEWAGASFSALLVAEPDQWQTAAGDSAATDAEPQFIYPWNGKVATESELSAFRKMTYPFPAIWMPGPPKTPETKKGESR